MLIAEILRKPHGLCAVALLLLGAQAHAQAPDAPRPPHVILILADDAGVKDVGYNNPDAFTPGINRLAKEGVMLDAFHTSPVCTPTRIGLLTGRYAMRTGLERWVVQPWSDQGLPRSEQILPELLREQGYGASAVFGKWHLGSSFSKFHPLNQGFDEFYGHYQSGLHYYHHELLGERDWHEGFESLPGEDGLYITDLVGQRAVRFIEEHAHDSQPFFLYLPFHAPHSPKQAPQALIDQFVAQGNTVERATHLAQMAAMDREIEQILKALDREGIADDTVVWFMSDNGADLDDAGDNGPLRGGKVSVYGGGIRTPSVVRYPNGRLIGGYRCPVLVSHVDVVPTVLGFIEEMAGSVTPPLRPFDGVDVKSSLRGLLPVPEKRHFAFYSPRDDGKEFYSVTSFEKGHLGWKLVWRERDLFPDPYDPNGAVIELYYLALDPGETTDLAAANPGEVQRLLDALVDWRSNSNGDDLIVTDDPPPGWEAPAEWAQLDDPLTCVPKFHMVFQAAGALEQATGYSLPRGPLVSVGNMSNKPDGQSDLVLTGLGLNPVDHLLYAVTEDGQEIYQGDANALVIELGEITGIAAPARITAGEVAPAGDAMFVFDDHADRLYRIELGNLVANEVPLSGDVPAGGLVLGDLVFDSAGDLLTYDVTSQRILTITTEGVVAQSARTFALGSYGALWVDVADGLYAYKDRVDGVAGGPGIYVLNRALGSVTLLNPGDALDNLDGAGCPFPPGPPRVPAR